MPPPGHFPLLLRRSIAGALAVENAARLWPPHARPVPRPAAPSCSCGHAQTARAAHAVRAFSQSTALRWPASAAAGGGGSVGAGSTGRGPGSAGAGAAASSLEDEHLKKSYFLSNSFLDRIAGLSPGSSLSSAAPALCDIPPHRRRQATRRRAQLEATAAATAATAVDADTLSAPSDLPANASTILTDMAARQTSARRLASSLLSLAKPRLTVLVVLTAMASYALYPTPEFLSPEVLGGPAAGDAAAAAAASSLLSPLTLLFLTTGTALCSASANALNMLYELGTDARMSRTRNRPLVRQLVSRRAALLFAVACGVAGVAALQWGVNPTVAFLGAANIALYAGVYTPMKRLSAANTWVGGLVGGIPPLMGWAAAAGEAATGSGSGRSTLQARELLFAPDGSSAGGWLLAALLFAWQFPHFMALSWVVRAEYQRAGLRMLSWVNPTQNARVALRYAAAFVPICVGLCAAGVTSWSFAATSLPVNLWLVRQAVAFWRFEGHQGTARRLFWASVWHLPAIMVLALLQKKGLWTRVYRSITGQPTFGEEEDDDDYELDGDGDYIWEEGRQTSQPQAQEQPPARASAAVSPRTAATPG